MKWNAEVGEGDYRGSISYSHQNSELEKKKDLAIRNSTFHSQNSKLIKHPITKVS
jgi:hypothetical protein